MVTIQNSLKITLKSDLCAGSGFSYAGLIDSDISYDKYGVPFISGRRLKGCMKESAYMIKTDQAQIKRIFGVSGDNGSYGVIIGNAFPVGWIKSVYLIATRDLSNLWLQFFLSQNQGFMRLFEKTVLK